jgi:hypothetical protein
MAAARQSLLLQSVKAVDRDGRGARRRGLDRRPPRPLVSVSLRFVEWTTMKRMGVVLAVALALGVGGCSKCGFIWDDYLPSQKSCRTGGATPG